MAKQQSISERALAAQSPGQAGGQALTPQSGSITVGGRTFRGVKQAVVPTLRQPGEAAVVFTVMERMRIGKPMPPDKNGQQMPRATVMRVTSLENGRLYDYIVPAILIGVFVSEYDGGKLNEDGTILTHKEPHELKGYNDYTIGTHTYVGKSFVVAKGKKPDGKRYREIEAIEIDPSEVIEQG